MSSLKTVNPNVASAVSPRAAKQGRGKEEEKGGAAERQRRGKKEEEAGSG